MPADTYKMQKIGQKSLGYKQNAQSMTLSMVLAKIRAILGKKLQKEDALKGLNHTNLYIQAFITYAL